MKGRLRPMSSKWIFSFLALHEYNSISCLLSTMCDADTINYLFSYSNLIALQYNLDFLVRTLLGSVKARNHMAIHKETTQTQKKTTDLDI